MAARLLAKYEAELAELQHRRSGFPGLTTDELFQEYGVMHQIDVLREKIYHLRQDVPRHAAAATMLHNAKVKGRQLPEDVIRKIKTYYEPSGSGRGRAASKRRRS